MLRKSKAEWYKPIQVAELLNRLRTGQAPAVNVYDLDSYRNLSKQWRNDVCIRLFGKTSTSSQRYQDDIWQALQPPVLATLDDQNRPDGRVESYIYRRYAASQESLVTALNYVLEPGERSFSLKELFDRFASNTSTRKSQDRLLECVVTCLFSSVLQVANASVTVDLAPSATLPGEVRDLAVRLVGYSGGTSAMNSDAKVMRGVATNSADGGIDAFTNYGLIIQVKNTQLKPAQVRKIVSELAPSRVVVVCGGISGRFNGEPLPENLVACVTKQELSNCFASFAVLGGEAYRVLLESLRFELKKEFPVALELPKLLLERSYIDPGSVEWS